MLEAITPEQALKKVQAGELRLVDIRETDEYAAESVPGARLIPLSVIDTQPVVDKGAPALPIAFFCHSGNRTTKAAARLEQAATRAGVPAVQIEGGITGWKKAGLPVEVRDMPMPLFRQIQIGAGGLVLLGLLGSLAHPGLIWVSAFVGAGLVFAGVTGFCGLGRLLALMPWNRRGK